MMAHQYVIGRLHPWIRIVMSFVDHRPLDARRRALEASPLVQSFLMRRTKETQEKIGAYFVSSSILDPRSSILIFCGFRKSLDDLRALLLRGASLVVSFKR